jgi:fumarylacetoacetase
MTATNTDPNDQTLRSFVETGRDSHFPIQNLPFGVFSTRTNPTPRVGVAIGDQILDLAKLEQAGLVAAAPGGANVFDCATLNAFLAQGHATWSRTRRTVSEILRDDNPRLRDDKALRTASLALQRDATLHLPVAIGGYTDFYSSREHATNVGMMFRDPKNALLPNWLHMPIGYNGRASSIGVSGTPVRRPNGQLKAADAERPTFGPCRKLDFELETAFIVGTGNAQSEPIPIADAEQHIFGMVLMNDWSARDVQQWEYVPLGPFNSKTFATTISPWVVMLDALRPFRVAGPVQEPVPLPYLQQSGAHGVDIALEVALGASGQAPITISRTNFKYIYWSMAQQLAHHTVTGCNTNSGDLMGSGTISGPSPDACGSLLEIAWNGTRPLALAGGGERRFLEDGDEVILTGYSQGNGYRVGFGEARGRILPERPIAS